MSEAVVTGQDTTDAGGQQAIDNAGAPAQPTPGSEPTGAQPTGEQGAQGEQKPAVEPVYEFKMPEGVELDKTAADEFVAIAKANGLKPDEAQKVADIGAKMMQRQVEAQAQLVSSWVEQVKADKDIGGDKLDQSLAVAKGAVEAFGSPELKDVLNATGLGNHPAVVKFFYQVGKRISPDDFVGGNRAPAGEKDPAKILFPSMN